MLGRGRLASPGCTSDWGSDLKLQRWSWRWYNSFLAITQAGEFSFCSLTTALGYCTCRGQLRWRAVKAVEESYWPRKLPGVMNWIILFTLTGKFLNLFLLLIGGLILFKSDKSLLFRMKKWKFITFLCWKVKNCYFFI